MKYLYFFSLLIIQSECSGGSLRSYLEEKKAPILQELHFNLTRSKNHNCIDDFQKGFTNITFLFNSTWNEDSKYLIDLLETNVRFFFVET